MPRSADYTIKGFLYQFNKTLLELLKASDDSVITVEGIVEDVEIVTTTETTLIQCKYHEASETYRPSSLFKPLLQMMGHFHENSCEHFRYVLFAHFPSKTGSPNQELTKSDFQAALNSSNKELQRYVNHLNGRVDLDQFSGKFQLEFGPPYDALVEQVCKALRQSGIAEGDIDTLAYPNAIHEIALISVKHDPGERCITRRQFLEHLGTIRKTAISRWTMALRKRKELLKARRKQLNTHLGINSRLRYIVVDAKSVNDFDEQIVLFVCDYIEKYHVKPAHISTPLLCLRTSTDTFQRIQRRLFTKGIVSTDGIIGGHFDVNHFFREPLSQKNARTRIRREFSLRLLRWEDNRSALNRQKCDDLFIIGTFDCTSMNTADVNVEHLGAATLKEIKYLLGVSDVCE